MSSHLSNHLKAGPSRCPSFGRSQWSRSHYTAHDNRESLQHSVTYRLEQSCHRVCSSCTNPPCRVTHQSRQMFRWKLKQNVTNLGQLENWYPWPCGVSVVKTLVGACFHTDYGGFLQQIAAGRPILTTMFCCCLALSSYRFCLFSLNCLMFRVALFTNLHPIFLLTFAFVCYSCNPVASMHLVNIKNVLTHTHTHKHIRAPTFDGSAPPKVSLHTQLVILLCSIYRPPHRP